MWSAGGIEVSFHRIGLAAWCGSGVLRSWADAPWRVVPEGVVVACGPDEALWLGLGVDGSRPSPGHHDLTDVTLTDAASGETARRILPRGWQLAALAGSDGAARPITLGAAPARRFRLDVVPPPGRPAECFELRLVAPAAWPSEWGPLDLSPAELPPPVAAYSRLVRPKPPRPSDA